jgi:hypothetical protein
MKKILFAGALFLILIAFFAGPAQSAPIGPATPPSWISNAQVKLGWEFSDPTNPQNSSPISGWNTSIGAAPVWSYQSDRDTIWGPPGQWYIRIPNLDNDNPSKNFWISWVYDFNYLDNPRIATNIDWSPFTGVTDLGFEDKWFKSDGTETTVLTEAAFGRWTQSLELYPNPTYEDVWLGLYSGSPYFVREVYIATECVPIPAAVWLLGSGLVGLITIRRRLRA